MSRAIKVSTIEQAENQINQQSRRIQDLHHQLAHTLQQAREEARREAQRRVADLRNETYEHIEGLQDEMSEMDRKHREALREQSVRMQKKIGELKEWTKDGIEQLRTHVDSSVKVQRERIDQIYAKEANERKSAEVMVNDLGLLFKAVGRRVNHRKFEPIRWGQLQRRLQSLQQSTTPAPSKIALAESLTHELWDLEENITLQELEFNALHDKALSEAKAVLELMERSQKETYFQDSEGNTIKDETGAAVQVQVDYWTNGKYNEVQQRVDGLRARLEREKMEPTLLEDDLHQLLAQLEEISTEQNELVVLAARRGIASQQRRDISEDIVDALEKQNFQVKKTENGDEAYSYLGDGSKPDFREGVYAVLKHGRTGMEVTVIIHPDEMLTTNHIVFHRNDASNLNPQELERSMTEVRKVIEERGYHMAAPHSPTGASGDIAIEELADVNALKARGISQATKVRLGFSRSK